MFSAVPPNGISYDGRLDRGSTDDKDDKYEKRRSIGSRNRCATGVCRWNIIAAAGSHDA